LDAVVASDSFKSRFAANTTNEGLVVSLFTAGAFFGALAAGYLGDLAGRRGTILAGTLIFVLGGGLQAGAQALAYVQSGRFVTGMGYAFTSS
jgi:MFS family permease